MERKQRIIKEPEERKSEILDAAERFFSQKGYEGTSVNDILAAVNIAKGTFYHHFKSKEDVLDTLIERRVQMGVKKAEEIIAAPLPPVQKLLAIMMAQKPQDRLQEDFISILHEHDNSKMHEKSIIQSITHLSPCLAKVFREGIEAGVFNTPFPLESAEILLAAVMVLFDDGFFQWTEKERAVKIAAFLNVVERTVGAE
ncbi:MAG: TetR/AcrR family transcriptional regulator, partial [Bacteroidales bacterium]|nr:TetR/AcrR family transcriptional regulator [Bacteroidales bacterium]